MVSVLRSRSCFHLLMFQLLAVHLSLRYYKRGRLVSVEPPTLELPTEIAVDVPSCEVSCEVDRASSGNQLKEI